MLKTVKNTPELEGCGTSDSKEMTKRTRDQSSVGSRKCIVSEHTSLSHLMSFFQGRIFMSVAFPTRQLRTGMHFHPAEGAEDGFAGTVQQHAYVMIILV